tara:strand:+ start:168 stop:818 length:651 start_codon:yes stop_codon:yes gene_type:complete
MEDSISNIVPLFSTPILHIKDSGFRCSDRELSSIDNLSYFPTDLGSCLLTKNVNLFELNYFSRIKKECEKHLTCYTKEILCIKQDFYITNSWITKKSLKSGYKKHHRHNHPNTIFSGVLYLDVEDGNDQKLFFSGKTGFLNTFNFDYDYTEYNMINSNRYWLPVNVGTCIIFPSHVNHWVEEIKTEGERIVMGFNCFVKGKMGGKEYASDINIYPN